MNKLVIAAALAVLLVAPGCNQQTLSGAPGTGSYAAADGFSDAVRGQTEQGVKPADLND
jgi:hypothetical protein